ncbi:hypothetical protein NYQ83_12070 [Afifella sp. JA880]|uniref:hypothetical protein n=1 Tax=Afifella sp. JA880 TaxID=2975280 RepID=UPI0021BACFFC|nr:hypothetical protein [Afifella sp. JA880]MCT8268011.1 hypothetical protein [Afifella sp. JA880]
MAADRKPEPHPRIDDFLDTPIVELSLEELPFFWRTTRVTIDFDRPADLEGGMRLPAAIRGALGEPLRAIAERDTGHPLGSLFHVMFADHCMFAERRHVPKPFVIWVREGAEQIRVEISLFGEAGCFREQLIEAVLRVMTPVAKGGEGGISLMNGRRTRRIWPLRDLFWQESGQYLPPPLRRRFMLSSLTPFGLSNQQTVRHSQTQLIASIFKRIAGLARWHRVQMERDLSFSRIDELVCEIEVYPVLEPNLSLVSRRSRSFQTKERVQTGFSTSLKVDAFPPELWPGFVLGTLTHAGYDVPQGYGRYEISAF